MTIADMYLLESCIRLPYSEIIKFVNNQSIYFTWIGFGQLKGKPGDSYHKAWAMYFAKFIKAYEDKGIKIWGITVQNEPSDGFIPG